jgi:hypothetical protein
MRISSVGLVKSRVDQIIRDLTLLDQARNAREAYERLRRHMSPEVLREALAARKQVGAVRRRSDRGRRRGAADQTIVGGSAEVFGRASSPLRKREQAVAGDESRSQRAARAGVCV